MGSCASSAYSIPLTKRLQVPSDKDLNAAFQGQHSKSTVSGSKRANDSNKDIDEHRIVKNRSDKCGENSPIEKVQAMSIDRSNKVKKFQILEGSSLNELKLVFMYSREGIDYDVPELGYQENSSILKRREKPIDYSPGISTADGTPKEFFMQTLISPTKPLRPYVNKVPKFFR